MSPACRAAHPPHRRDADRIAVIRLVHQRDLAQFILRRVSEPDIVAERAEHVASTAARRPRVGGPAKCGAVDAERRQPGARQRRRGGARRIRRISRVCNASSYRPMICSVFAIVPRSHPRRARRHCPVGRSAIAPRRATGRSDRSPPADPRGPGDNSPRSRAPAATMERRRREGVVAGRVRDAHRLVGVDDRPFGVRERQLPPQPHKDFAAHGAVFRRIEERERLRQPRDRRREGARILRPPPAATSHSAARPSPACWKWYATLSGSGCGRSINLSAIRRCQTRAAPPASERQGLAHQRVDEPYARAGRRFFQQRAAMPARRPPARPRHLPPPRWPRATDRPPGRSSPRPRGDVARARRGDRAPVDHLPQEGRDVRAGQPAESPPLPSARTPPPPPGRGATRR